jgi:hypothetical protein
MLGNVIAFGVLLGIAALALDASASPPVADPATRRDLEAVASRSILFGHMSVGMDLLDGVQKLAAREGVALRVVDVSGSPSTAPSTLSHLFLGNNGDAPAKLDAFSRALASLASPSPDIALVKFCYVDFATGTDAHALFSRYQATIEGLRSRHPKTTFVHVTAPLSAVQGGPKAWAKRLLGKTPYGFVENARREEFNVLVRRAYAGRDPLFDLARVESTLPDGGRATVEWNGQALPVLAAAWTDDGGHLNENGRLRAARELAAVLAAVPAR